ncbi:hypothetical protein EV426DRAFT_704324 [Tirmania nivea]|nr:hypothetical protein EV426DRAFT_704324 [Tirmania nivea]
MPLTRKDTETMTIDDVKGKGSGRRFSLDATLTGKNPIQKPALSQSQQVKGYKSGEPDHSAESSPIKPTVAEARTVTLTQVTYGPGMNENLTVKTPTPSALDFWAEADTDKAVTLPPWKRERPLLEELTAGLPGVRDGASDSKVSGAGNKLKKKKDNPKVRVLTVVNGKAEDDDKILLTRVEIRCLWQVIKLLSFQPLRFLLSNPQTNLSALEDFPRSFQPGRLEIYQRHRRRRAPHSNKNSKIEEDLNTLLDLPLPTEKLYRPTNVSSRLDTLEKYLDEQGAAVETVLKRMLWIVDSMVL